MLQYAQPEHPQRAALLYIADGTLIARAMCAMFWCPRSETSSL